MVVKKIFLTLLSLMTIQAHAQTTEASTTELQLAIEKNDAARVAYLFREKRLDPNFYLPNGDTPLVYAIRVDAMKTVNLVMLRHRALNVKIPSLRGETPLMLAAIKGDVDLAQTLLHLGADVNVNFGWTALHYAAATGQKPMIDWLIKNGAEINVVTERQVTPLYMAARATSLEAVNALLSAGADKTICNDQGISPAAVAKQRGNTVIAERLAIDACKIEKEEATIVDLTEFIKSLEQGESANAQNPTP